MSKKSLKKSAKGKNASRQEWPVVVYFWAFGLALVSYLVVEAVFRTTLAHPVHWLAGLIGGVIGIPVGWIWYRFRGDVF